MKKENDIYDLVGVGIGPFNLSLIALLAPLKSISLKFLDGKSEFSWHPELMFGDATMQTSYLKDLVTPVMPTNPYSFLNYLVSNGQFYHFLNTGRQSITRFEFEAYCKWVSREVSDFTEFDSKVLGVEHVGDKFKVISENCEYEGRKLCVASGPRPNIPACARSHLGHKVFHAKSKEIKDLSVDGKRVLIVGGGQTGVEIFRNMLKDKWGRSQSVKLITGRENLMPLDEGPFTNEVFTPEFVSNFHSLSQKNKDSFTESLLLTSDGNTPSYLQELYNELYLDKFYHKAFPAYDILPMRWLEALDRDSDHYVCRVKNRLNERDEDIEADIIILATGFKTKLPDFLDGLHDKISFDELGRPNMARDYKLVGDFGENEIYTMNYSRHGHGIADPQTSLMSWRSAVIANALLGHEQFKNTTYKSSFINFFTNGN
ncbi:MAG: SidA/IucD/PvdA family monooxygenase [Bacteriovoracaceae bacterium]|nr:SidA/IucD/PvdA family monooxygenase [Bacteriovoracaceae bacterium]